MVKILPDCVSKSTMLHFCVLPRRVSGLFLIFLLALPMGIGCDSPPATPDVLPSPVPSLERSQVIVLGDIDADEPVKKVKRFSPLAEYLAENLSEQGIRGGKVVIASSIEEMGRFLKEGEVDIYFDSGFPTLEVQRLSGSQIILRRWKQESATYWSTFVARRDSGIDSIEDFVGKIVAFEEPYSTSGFILPAGTMKQRGFNLRRVSSPTAEAGPDEIGFFFSLDEDNTIELILEGRVAGGGISNQDYESLPPELMDRLVRFDRTITVPRQLVSVRPGLAAPLVEKVRDLLVGLERTEEGRQLLAGLKKTSRFDALFPETEASLAELQELIRLVSEGQPGPNG